MKLRARRRRFDRGFLSAFVIARLESRFKKLAGSVNLNWKRSEQGCFLIPSLKTYIAGAAEMHGSSSRAILPKSPRNSLPAPVL